jgi:hypothetical protein
MGHDAARPGDPLRFTAATADASRALVGYAGEPTGRLWLQILDVIEQLELRIAVYQHDRRTLELWAAREREAIEQERERMRQELVATSSRQEPRFRWIARYRRRPPRAAHHQF